MLKKLKIEKISKKPYKGKVYNMELKTNSNDGDDLFWIEQKTGIVTHNCFPKDVKAFDADMPNSLTEFMIKYNEILRGE